MRFRATGVVCALVLSCSFVLAQAKRDLRVKGKVGDLYAYKLSSTIAPVGNRGQLEFGATFTEKLVKLSGGQFHWLTTFAVTKAIATGAMKGGEAGIRQLDGLQMTSVQNANAEVLKLLVNGAEVPNRGSANVTLPGRPVAIGEKWSATIEVSNQLVPINYRLAGYEKLGGRTAARIEGSFPPGAIARATKPTRFWVDVANGKMLKGEADTIVTTQGMEIRVTYLIQRGK